MCLNSIKESKVQTQNNWYINFALHLLFGFKLEVSKSVVKKEEVSFQLKHYVII